MKKFISAMLALLMIAMLDMQIFAESGAKYSAETELSISDNIKADAASAILIEAESGKVLYSQNENEKRSPASVTKIMTLLLIMEAISDGRIAPDEKVTVSEYASSMGGSQVFLKEGEQMSVEELLKCTVIASANDAAVALAEHTYGSEDAFVMRMNERAKELGMTNTDFENVTGLDDTVKSHLTTAMDIALMSRELIRYDLITKYSSMWQDTVRDGEFTLTNTNRLVRYYDGCNGLKTGSTDKAGYCISVSAKRNGMQLIAVIMGAESRDARNKAARELLDLGFATYGIYKTEAAAIEDVPVIKGVKEKCTVWGGDFSAVVQKSDIKSIRIEYDIPEVLNAPIYKDQPVGKMIFKLGDEVIGECDITVKESIESVSFIKIWFSMLLDIFCGQKF